LEPKPELRKLERQILEHDPALPAAPTPAQHSLPAPPTRLIGRERELAEMEALLRTTRLVTLTGPGGSGKTRLALELAWRREGRVAFVELGSVATPELVPSAIAATLKIREFAAEPLLETLKRTLREQPLLLILDSLEHLLASGPTVAELLITCPQLNL